MSGPSNKTLIKYAMEQKKNNFSDQLFSSYYENVCNTEEKIKRFGCLISPEYSKNDSPSILQLALNNNVDNEMIKKWYKSIRESEIKHKEVTRASLASLNVAS